MGSFERGRLFFTWAFGMGCALGRIMHGRGLSREPADPPCSGQNGVINGSCETEGMR
jgi:hypothetical protein